MSQTYYSSQKRFETLFDTHGRKQKFSGSTLEEFTLWQQDVRGTLTRLLGLSKLESCPLNPQIIEVIDLDYGIRREKVVIQVEPGVYMPMYILLPNPNNQIRIQDKPACLIAPAGHMSGGKLAVAGNRELKVVSDTIDRFNYDYGLQASKLGYIAICPDTRGFGERREVLNQDVDDETNQILSNSCLYLARMAEPLGLTVAGLCTWDLMRLIDYIVERNEWDKSSIGCIGFSGGGMQTLWLAALDDRVRSALISGYMYGYKDSLLKLHGNCSCNYVPGLWEALDMGDVGALIAPRTLMIQSCADDHLNGERGLRNVDEQMDILRRAYRLFESETYLSHDIHPGGHSWHGENLENFLTISRTRVTL